MLQYDNTMALLASYADWEVAMYFYTKILERFTKY